MAVIHAALGNKKQALDWLEKAYDSHDSWMDYVAMDPRLDGLRADSRFVNLLRRMQLPTKPPK